ncbi:hypothetical protein MLD38_001931 [Melastoma candidum]|uniref:Uncharacterized protein n=2 Tax=Melastoma candidum TaxID=119954 RepID=A0ACB9SFR9_9MYRT|nr:hypothetical protein MLD38_001931 [Melastoma candidum]
MADQEEEENLRTALRMSMQTPEPKRSRLPPDSASPVSPSPEDCDVDGSSRRAHRRELMAAAAEKRLLASRATSSAPAMAAPAASSSERRERVGRGLSGEEARELFEVVFCGNVSKGILSQWTNQGIRFSEETETSMGLVQHEGGPCGVLAALQAFILKYLLFSPEDLQKSSQSWSRSKSSFPDWDKFSSLTQDERLRALIRSMSEILFSCGARERAVIATLRVSEGAEVSLDERIANALDGLSIESAADLQKIIEVETYNVQSTVLQRLEAALPAFRSRMGAMLFLFSALLSRGLDAVQADRDDHSLPLVTAPFGHASQEIVNLLLSGEAVANVFDGRMDLGGGMSLKGISGGVEVGFLTLLESLILCKVGQHLKCPKWPIWVVGSESHYTVLFALDTDVQHENEFEERESQIRRAFDAHDQSGGGGFIGVEGFHQVLRETDIRLPPEKVDRLGSAGFIVWSEFWQAILNLDKDLGGLKDSSGLMGKKVFDLYHFNGIAKSDLNGQAASSSETPMQRPRLTKLRVSVPPRWTPEEFMAEVSDVSNDQQSADGAMAKAEPPQHAPLVDCIRTRWPRAVCNWTGDPPSIV